MDGGEATTETSVRLPDRHVLVDVVDISEHDLP